MKQVKTLLENIENFQKANNHDADLRTLLNSYKITLGALENRGNLSNHEQRGVQVIAQSLHERKVIDQKTFEHVITQLNNVLSDKEIEIACDEAYKKAGHNAYFGNGFKAGVEWAIKNAKVNA